MTHPQTEALVKRYIDAFNDGDHDAMLSCLSEEVVHDINQGDREIGVEKFRWFLARMAAHYDERLADVVIMTGQGGTRAAAEFTVKGTYLKTADGLPEAHGQSYSIPAAILFEIDEGRITRVSTHYNLRDWITAVSR